MSYYTAFIDICVMKKYLLDKYIQKCFDMKFMFNPLEFVVLMTNYIQLFVHDPHITISNEETFLQDFHVILKRLLQNYLKILKRCTLGITFKVTCSNHARVLSAAKGSNL